MRSKSVLTSLVVLVAVIGATYVLYSDESTDVNKLEVPNLEKQNKSEYDQIAIRKGERLVVMKKRDDNRWVLDGTSAFLVGETSIKSVLDKLAKLALAEVISAQPGDLAVYDLDDENAVEVTASRGSKPLRHFKLGKTGGGYSATFIQMMSDDEVYLSKTSLRSTFDRDEDAWKDKIALSFNSKEVKRVEVIDRDGTFAFVKKEIPSPEPNSEEEAETPPAKKKFEWIMEDEPIPVEQSKVRSLIRSLSNLRATDVVAESEKEKTGFDNPWLEVSVELEDQTRHEIVLGELATEAGNRYLQVLGKPYHYILPKTLVERLGLFRQTYLVQQELEKDAAPPDSKN